MVLETEQPKPEITLSSPSLLLTADRDLLSHFDLFHLYTNYIKKDKDKSKKKDTTNSNKTTSTTKNENPNTTNTNTKNTTNTTTTITGDQKDIKKGIDESKVN